MLVFQVKVFFLRIFVCFTEVGERIGKEIEFKISRFVSRNKFGYATSHCLFFLMESEMESKILCDWTKENPFSNV